ncbi:MAG: actin depolymerizing protein [Lentinula lateritia]|nr:MAG: actin depolymerizing protein [Lentinula lateritia]
MAELSDPQITEAYQDVRSDKTDTNWLLIDYESDRSDTLKLTQTGTGGLAELREVLDDSRASFAYVRVQYSNDKESVREKYLSIRLPHTSSLCIAFQTGSTSVSLISATPQISVHAADVKAVLRVYSFEVAAQEKDDINEDPIVLRLRKAGGASYDGV